MPFSSKLWGLPLHDIVIPLFAWAIIATYYIYQMYRRVTDNRAAISNMKKGNYYHHNYFYHMRSGWVHKNFLSGQGTANSTRDYLRVLLFLVGNTATVAALVLGYASVLFKETAPEDRMLLVKLALCGLIFSIMFFMFIFSTRYAVQFHFLMNIDKDCHGVPMNKNVIITVFHRSHAYYGAGIRLYYTLIPMFAWAISSWFLLAVCPLYVWAMRDYDNNEFLEKELENMYRNTEFGRFKQLERQESTQDEVAHMKIGSSMSEDDLTSL